MLGIESKITCVEDIGFAINLYITIYVDFPYVLIWFSSTGRLPKGAHKNNEISLKN